MRKFNIILTTLTLCSLTFFASCKKPIQDQTAFGNDAWVLNEGSWGGNNACLDAINTQSGAMVKDHAFLTQNGRGLGDLAQDMIIIGEKLFVSVSESNTIEVINALTGESIKQINMGNRYPRYLATDGTKLYATCYSPRSVVRINAETFEIESTCELTGCMQPEQLCYFDKKLYICSGWQSNSNSGYEYDNKVAVVDLATFQMIETITVGRNPNRIKVVGNGKLAISYLGDYASNPAGCAILDPKTKEVNTLPIAFSNFDNATGSNTIIGYSTSYDATWNPITEFYQVNLNTMEYEKILESINISNPYGIHINPHTEDILICNGPYGSNGDIYCYTHSGKLLWKVDANIFPSKIVWLPSSEPLE